MLRVGSEQRFIKMRIIRSRRVDLASHTTLSGEIDVSTCESYESEGGKTCANLANHTTQGWEKC